ncbi:MAG TPA: translocation/assembly module TamB domain-containing protein [Gemmatimonadaceae bacterium]|nr:translocation/assembly module TamB domain-containing protein [Gemmatimonadaceae bacterium]
MVLLTGAMIVILTIIFAGIAIGITQTAFGREQIRRLVSSQLSRSVEDRGSLTLGTLHGSLLTGLTFDSLAIRDAEDSLFVSTGPIRVTYDIRDLIDRRLRISHLRVERAVVHFRRHADGTWNYRRVFPSGPPKPPSLDRRISDFIVMDSVEVLDSRVTLTQMWSPPDSLRGARRDSAVRVALGSWGCGSGKWDQREFLERPCGAEIRESSEGLTRTYRWLVREASLGRVRLADPDSAGRQFEVRRLDVDEPDPPFSFRNVRGSVRWLGDTIWMRLPHWDLPRSTGRAAGRVHWGAGPMRYDITVRGDSVSLADINWVYPTLPSAGGGSMALRIRNDTTNPDVLDYAISDMDVRSTGSHLLGSMTFGVGAPVLIVKDLDLRADPVDFRLIEQLNGEPLPVPWAGQITGTLRARGGPVTRFAVNDAQLVFRDAHVPGAVTRARARGALDILAPSRTKFRGLDVDVETLDLRTIRYLYPNFARLGGTIGGRATLDSSWLDVRFRDADLTHLDGPGTPTRVTGSGRITYGEQLMYDASLELLPASMTMLARSYPIIPFRGPFRGPMRVSGVIDSLSVETTLRGAGGEIGYTGWVDADSIGGFAVYGEIRARDVDLGPLFDLPSLPSTLLNGRFVSALRFDSLANMRGTLAATLGRSVVDSIRVFPSGALLRFADGRMMVDSLRLETTAALVTAQGGLGLEPAVEDSLRMTIVADSIGGLRPYLRPGEPVDSTATPLAGFVRLNATLAGSVGALRATGDVNGVNLGVGEERADRLQGGFDLFDLTGVMHGQATLVLDQLQLAGIRLARGELTAGIRNDGSTRFTLSAESETGPRLGATMDVQVLGDNTSLTLDSLALVIDERVWALARPARIQMDSTGIAIDSLLLRQNGKGAFTLAGAIPRQGPISFGIQLDSLPLGDVATVMQSRAPYSGWLTMTLDASGTRASPVYSARATADSVRIGATLALPHANLDARYERRRAAGRLNLLRRGIPVLFVTATLPVDLALVPSDQRLLAEPLNARIEAREVDLALLQAMAPTLFSDVRGSMTTEVTVGGTWERPTFDGALRVADGTMGLPALGITLREVDADVAMTRDSVRIVSLSARSGERNGYASLTGRIGLDRESLTDLDGLRFDLRLVADNFQAMRQRRVADLDVSGDLRLTDRFTSARLAGNLTIERGTLYLQDQPTKELVALDDPDFRDVVDVAELESRGVLRARGVLDQLVENLTLDNVSISIGDEVWLRSTAANIKLGGTVGVLRTGDRLALAGTVTANRGEYRLDLGLVQRRFDVTRGDLRFFGEPGINPALDITAAYTVRQVDRPDVRIRADIGGTLLDPRLALSSDERIAISTTEILSYLVFGAPTFALGQENTAAINQAIAALLPTVGTLFERELVEEVGFFDLFQIQTPALGQQGLTDRSFLSGLRLGVGKQLGERTFVTANAGLCAINERFTEALGVTVEQRLDKGFSLQFGTEPATISLLCDRGVADINTPRQFGFDLFREWSF